jgi:hypothetical protein
MSALGTLAHVVVSDNNGNKLNGGVRSELTPKIADVIVDNREWCRVAFWGWCGTPFSGDASTYDECAEIELIAGVSSLVQVGNVRAHIPEGGRHAVSVVRQDSLAYGHLVDDVACHQLGSLPQPSKRLGKRWLRSRP